MRRIVWVMLVLLCVVAAAPAARAQGGAGGPDAVVRGFYAWYLGRLEKDDWSPLDSRREALKYPAWRVRAPRVSGDEGVNVIVCA